MTAHDPAMPKGAYVYAITVDGTLIYLGKGRNGRAWSHERIARRLNEHRASGKKVKRHLLYNKLRRALHDGAKIGVHIIKDGISDKEAYAAEYRLVKTIGKLVPLCNLKSGGCGFSSEDALASWNNPARRERQREMTTARWMDPSYRELVTSRISEAQKLRYQRPAARDLMRAANWGNPEVRAPILEASNNRWQDPEYKARLGAKSKARWEDPEYKERVRSSLTAKWQEPEAAERRKARMRDPEVQARRLATRAARRPPKAAVEAPPKSNSGPRRIITPLGIFPSRAAAAAAHGISKSSATSRARNQSHGFRYADCDPLPKKKKLSQPNRRSVMTPIGRFESVLDAARAHGIAYSAAKMRAKNQRKGWHYVEDKLRAPNPHHSARPVITPLGTFPTARAAAAAHGVKITTGHYRAKHQIKGWRFADEEPRANSPKPRRRRYIRGVAAQVQA